MMDILQLEFMQRAFIAGVILGPLLAVLGSFVTLRKMSFFADGIAHASLFGVALAIVAGVTPFYGAIVVGVIFGILVFLFERYGKLASDNVIGIIFTFGLALGVIIISQQPGYQPDLISYLFGNILSITWSHVWIIVGLSFVILSLIILFFRQYVLLSLSEEIAWVSGVAVNTLELLFYVMLSIAVVLGVKLLGIVLVSALLVTPAVTSRLMANSFNNYVVIAVVLSLISFVGGLLASYYLDLPSGASIVVLATIIFIITFMLRSLFSLHSKK